MIIKYVNYGNKKIITDFDDMIMDFDGKKGDYIVIQREQYFRRYLIKDIIHYLEKDNYIKYIELLHIDTKPELF